MQHYSGEFKEKYDFDDYFKTCSVSDDTKDKLEINDLLVLPVKFNSQDDTTSYFLTQETIDFVKHCRKNESEIKSDILADTDIIATRNLNSYDIFLPIIFIAKEVIFPIAINLVSSFIFNKMKGHEQEDCEVEVKFIVNRDGEQKELYYKGKADAFKEKFTQIDINSL